MNEVRDKRETHTANMAKKTLKNRAKFERWWILLLNKSWLGKKREIFSKKKEKMKLWKNVFFSSFWRIQKKMSREKPYCCLDVIEWWLWTNLLPKSESINFFFGWIFFSKISINIDNIKNESNLIWFVMFVWKQKFPVKKSFSRNNWKKQSFFAICCLSLFFVHVILMKIPCK